MMQKRSPWLWVGLFAALFAIQAWIVPVVIRAVTGAEWFKGSPDEGGDSLPISNERTAAAFSHCNRHLQSRMSHQRFQFSHAPDRSWDIGFDRYMIQASFDVDDAEAGSRRRGYLCRIHYRGGDESDAANWSVAGFEFTPP